MVRITPAAEDLRKARAMLEREQRAGPHPGKARIIAALEARIVVLERRAEKESEGVRD